MDKQTQKTILYDTLGPLNLSFKIPTPPSTPPPQPSPDQSPPSDQTPYTVFRNEISLSAIRCSSVEFSTPDFVSLNVGEVDEGNADEPRTMVDGWRVEPEKMPRPGPGPGDEPRLESGWFRGNSRLMSPMLQLHKEIVDFCDFLSPTPEEQASRDAAVECVFNVIKYIWPDCKIEVFGSFRTGLYLPTSDIDVVILESRINKPQKGLQALARALSQKAIAKKIQVIAKARVPIVKFVEKRSGVAFDISFDAQNGPKAADFIKNAVSRLPPLRSLCLILKVFLQQRDLNEVYSGGIGSYALLAMLIAMLQSLGDGQPYPELNLGVLLVRFFDFYGRKLNTTDVGVSCRGAGTFFLKSRKGFTNKGRPFLISIEDPQAPDNDIGKNSFNYFQIRSAFSVAFSTLTNPKTILGLGQNRSILGTIIRPDPVLLERKGGSNKGVTFNTLLPGAGEPLQMNNGDEQEILGNWQFDDEEPLPRRERIAGDVCVKKRKSSSKESSSKKKVKEEENGSRKEKSIKKKRWRNGPNDSNGFGRNGGESPWSY